MTINHNSKQKIKHQLAATEVEAKLLNNAKW